MGCCGCCHPAKRLGNACPQAAQGVWPGCSGGPECCGVETESKPVRIAARFISSRHAVASHNENTQSVVRKTEMYSILKIDSEVVWKCQKKKRRKITI